MNVCLVYLESNVLEDRMYLFHNQWRIQDFPEDFPMRGTP